MRPAVLYHSRQGHNKALAMAVQEEFGKRGVEAALF